MKRRWTRRRFLQTGTAAAAVGCAVDSGDGSSAPGVEDTHVAQSVDSGPTPAPDSSGTGQRTGAPDEGPPPGPAPDPDIDPEFWHNGAPWVRATASGEIGTRFNLFNPADVPMAVNLHLFDPAGAVVAQEHGWRSLQPSMSVHVTLAQILSEAGRGGDFEGCVWFGSKPESGPTYLGLQGCCIDYYGPGGHTASVHAMRDFGNSNHDLVWTDLVLPRVVNGERFETWVAISNASGFGGDLPKQAVPEIIIGSDDGAELGKLTLDPIPAYGCRLVELSEIVGDTELESGTIRVVEPELGLVAYAFVLDKVHGGFTNADHFFDRHFVDCVPYGKENNCGTFLEPF